MHQIQREIRKTAESVNGRIGVCVRDIGTGREIGFNADEPLPMASTCKVPILVEAYRRHDCGSLDLGERVEFTESCRCLGSGLLNAFDPGLKPTIHDLLLMMIVVSDNAATDLIVDRLGIDEINKTMEAHGLAGIRLNRTIRDLLDDIGIALDPRLKGVRYGDWDARCEQNPGLKEKTENLEECRRAVNEAAVDRDTATAGDMARLCAQIARNECVSPESCDAIVDILNEQQLNTRLPRDVPAFVKFPHKTGTLGSGAVVNDVGILYLNEAPVAAVAVLSRDVRDPIHVTSARLAAMGRAVYDHYSVSGASI